MILKSTCFCKTVNHTYFKIRQGLELLITAPIVLTVFAAAMAGALMAPVVTRGLERSVKENDDIEFLKFKNYRD
jgi:hypothetical protein